MSGEKKKALFVCLGNTCRSPIAEGVFKKTVTDLDMGEEWEVDSAATSDWHVGEPPNWRSLDVMHKYGVPYNNYARQIMLEDFYYNDYIFGMDESNVEDLHETAPKDSKAKILLFGDFDPEGERNIRDPYCDRDFSGFEKCYEQSLRCTKGFLEHLQKK